MIAPLLLALVVGGAVDDEPGPSGLALGASVDGGVVGGDVVGGASVSVGVETQPFSLHLKAPLLFRAVDVDPAVDASLPSSCHWLRCEELLDGQQIDPTAIARVVDELRVFSPSDLAYLRAGQLTATLGDGGVVDRVTTAASWDRRTSGAYAALRLPWKRLDVALVVFDVVSPAELFGAHVGGAPFDDDSVFGGVFVFADGAADLFAPVDVVDRFGEVPAGAAVRTLTSSQLTAGWRLLDGTFSFAPRVEAGVVTGLDDDGAADDGYGAGAGVGVGVDSGVDVGVVDARLKLTGSWGQPGYRRSVFSTLHLVERRSAIAGASVDDGGLLRVPAPGGPGFDVRLEASVFDVAAPIARLHLEAAPGGNTAELGVVVDADPVQVSASLLRRGFLGADVVGLDVDGVPLVGAVAVSWRFYGPFSISLRWLRLPRFTGASGGDGGLRIDDDVLVSLSANTVLTSR